MTDLVPLAPASADGLNLDDTLADGAIILRLSFQPDWIYAVAAKDGRLVRRRYRYGQRVAIRPATTGEVIVAGVGSGKSSGTVAVEASAAKSGATTWWVEAEAQPQRLDARMGGAR